MGSPKTLADVNVGDEVVMVYRTGRNRTLRGLVTGATRVNLLIVAKDDPRDWYVPLSWRVRRDTGTEHPPGQQLSASGWKAFTVEQHEHEERLSAAFRVLRQHGISIANGTPWRGREIELADLLTAHVAEREFVARNFDQFGDVRESRNHADES